MSRFSVVLAIALLAGPTLATTPAQNAAPARQNANDKPAPASARMELTVDSIMRGPDLVGYPPTALRWSADSQKLYFDWRKPGEEESSTYVVGRDGGEPRKLTEEEAKNTPPAGGRWDKARRRALTTDAGDIVLVDGTTGARRQLTRTNGNESNPRWARNDTHVTYVRDGNLFIMPVDGSGTLITQLTDVAAKRPEPRLTDSQKFIQTEEEKLLEYVREQKE